MKFGDFKFGDFIDRLCYSDKVTIQIRLYADGFDNPIAIVEPYWKGVEPYVDRKITSIRIEEFNSWVLEMKILLETPIFGQAFNPD